LKRFDTHTRQHISKHFHFNPQVIGLPIVGGSGADHALQRRLDGIWNRPVHSASRCGP
jgi:hypothetical protein